MYCLKVHGKYLSSIHSRIWIGDSQPSMVIGGTDCPDVEAIPIPTLDTAKILQSFLLQFYSDVEIVDFCGV